MSSVTTLQKLLWVENHCYVGIRKFNTVQSSHFSNEAGNLDLQIKSSNAKMLTTSS